MANYFTINGKRYTAPKFDFNAVCEFEEAGIPLAEAKNKSTAMIRVYFSLLFDGDKETAGNELEKHMIDGGTLEELADAMTKELQESRFFQAVSKKSAETSQETESEKTPKRK